LFAVHSHVFSNACIGSILVYSQYSLNVESASSTTAESSCKSVLIIDDCEKNADTAQRKTRNPIYYFSEEVNENADGSVEANVRSFKCYLGNRRVLKIGQKMNGSTHGTKTFV
jgi:hypothetical protein